MSEISNGADSRLKKPSLGFGTVVLTVDAPVKRAMRLAAGFMTRTAYYL